MAYLKPFFDYGQPWLINRFARSNRFCPPSATTRRRE